MWDDCGTTPQAPNLAGLRHSVATKFNDTRQTEAFFSENNNEGWLGDISVKILLNRTLKLINND